MTNNDCLDPIRPINGNVGDDMQSEEMEIAAEGNKDDQEKKAEGAEVGEMRKP